MQSGLDARAALERLLAEDDGAAGRQVAMVDAQGRVAAHTGASAIAFAGHVTGEGVSCQANIMESARVWPAMLDAYTSSQGPLTTRLLAALDAAEAQGGDARGRQSAAILVVPPQGDHWDKVIELRVEDDPEPLVELRRVVRVHDAYQLADRADGLAGEGRHDEAAALCHEASALDPGNHELRFWAGLGAAQAGDLDAGLADVRAAIDTRPQWRELLERLPSDLAPSAQTVLERLG